MVRKKGKNIDRNTSRSNVLRKILASVKKYLKKPNVPAKDVAQALYDIYNSKILTTYSNKVKGTVLDPQNPKGRMFRKRIQNLTRAQIKRYIVRKKNISGEVEGRGRKKRMQNTQAYLERKHRLK